MMDVCMKTVHVNGFGSSWFQVVIKNRVKPIKFNTLHYRNAKAMFKVI